MIYEVTVGETARLIDVQQADGGGWWVAVDGGERRKLSGAQVGAAEWLLAEGDRTQTHAVFLDGDRAQLQVRGHSIGARIVDPRSAALEGAAGGQAGEVTTPMPGVVVRVLVEVGQAVVAGQVLLVVEAMKMENEYKSAIDGVVTRIAVSVGDTLAANTLLATVSAD
ncbi:MAG: biotin carboxyl carrier protein [Myxococcota bacterium]|jgi:biotin carboxyl carrier protein